MELIFGLVIIGTAFAVLFTKFLFKDLSKYFWFETINTLKGFKKRENNIGDLFITYIIAGLIGFTSFLLYKAILTLSAYVLSSDLIAFFIRNRGVFTSEGVNLQNPFLSENIFYGLLLTPLAQLCSVYALVVSLKSFMSYLNAKVGKTIFGISDLVYFSTVACLYLVVLDVFVYYQSITVVNTFSNVVLQIGAKLSYLLYLFSILHITLLKKESYVSSLKAEIVHSIINQKVLSNSRILVPIIFTIGVILHLPLHLGFQFGSNDWLIIFQLFVAGTILYLVLRFTCAKGFNYIGVYLIDESRDMQIEVIHKFPFVQNKWFRYALGSVLVLFLIIIPKSIFLFAFFMFLFFLGIVSIIIAAYAIGTLISRIRFDWNTCSDVLHSLKPALIPSISVLLLVFIILSVFPKKFSVENYANYQTNVVDNKGHLLYKSSADYNPGSPISYEDLPEFFVRVLIAKEDRGFMNQNSLMLNKTNWHGISITGHSNLNQQLIKNLAFDGQFPQEIQRKLTEFASSYQLSLNRNSESIFTHYINNVSFNGGRNHKGIVNGSLYTFGKNITQLNELEMIYLLMTLHRGSDFKIYKQEHLVNTELTTLLERKRTAKQVYKEKEGKEFTEKNGNYQVVNTVNDYTFIKYDYIHFAPQTCKNQLLVFAEIWQQEGLLSRKELTKMKKQTLHFTNKPYKLKSFASTNTFYSKEIKKYPETYISYGSSISKQTQEQINEAVNAFFKHFKNQKIKDGNKLYAAALVIDVKTGNILAHYGGEGVSDLANFKNGNPMGSVIKPFVLLQLLENGYEIKLYDGKLNGVRVPNNYNNRNSNQYKNTAQILGPSLNTTFGNIYDITDPIALFVDVESKFKQMGIRSDKFLNLKDSNKKTEYRIGYPIGSSRNMTLFDIGQAYQTLFNNGEYKSLSILDSRFNPYSLDMLNFDKKATQVYSKANVYHIQDALKTVLESGGTGYSLNKFLPNNVKFMGKTGTTDEYRHGYTVLSDGKTLVVSWVSYGKEVNSVLKLGQTSIPNKSGGGSAGVLASLIFKQLYDI